MNKNSKIKLLYGLIFRVSKFEFERIRGKKLDFHRLFRLIGFLRRPAKWRASSWCFVHDTYRILGGGGWIVVEILFLLSKSRYDTIERLNEKLSLCLNCVVEFRVDRKPIVDYSLRSIFNPAQLFKKIVRIFKLSFKQEKKEKKTAISQTLIIESYK